MKRKATKELCPACYYRTRHYVKMIECASCGATKQHAAFGLCVTCYRRWGKNHAEGKREFYDRRYVTCDRILRTVRNRINMRTKYCDQFCSDHNPARNLRRNIQSITEATAAELQRRKDEALLLQH